MSLPLCAGWCRFFPNVIGAWKGRGGALCVCNLYKMKGLGFRALGNRFNILGERCELSAPEMQHHLTEVFNQNRSLLGFNSININPVIVHPHSSLCCCVAPRQDANYLGRVSAMRLYRQLAELHGDLARSASATGAARAYAPTVDPKWGHGLSRLVEPAIRHVAAARYDSTCSFVGRSLLRQALGFLLAVCDGVSPRQWQQSWWVVLLAALETQRKKRCTMFWVCCTFIPPHTKCALTGTWWRLEVFRKCKESIHVCSSTHPRTKS